MNYPQTKDTYGFSQLKQYKAEYSPAQTSKYPDKKIAIVTCMDTRLLTFLPAALGIKNGDVKMIKNADYIMDSVTGELTSI